MKDNILSQLLIKCPFPEVFENTETVEGCSFPEPRRKIGHILLYDFTQVYSFPAYL